MKSKVIANYVRLSGPVALAEVSIVLHEILKDASPSLIENILENQKKEEALLEEQHEFLQAKLAHDYDNYVDALSLSQERTRDSGIVNSGVTLKKDVQNSGIPMWSTLHTVLLLVLVIAAADSGSSAACTLPKGWKSLPYHTLVQKNMTTRRAVLDLVEDPEDE